MTATEIAQYLCFCDLSHFLNTYRKIKGAPFRRSDKNRRGVRGREKTEGQSVSVTESDG